jgi:hypothetical protein
MSTDIGARNIDFVRQYVNEAIMWSPKTWRHPSTQGGHFPDSGLIRVKRLAAVDQSLADRDATTSTN